MEEIWYRKIFFVFEIVLKNAFFFLPKELVADVIWNTLRNVWTDLYASSKFTWMKYCFSFFFTLFFEAYNPASPV